jgi:hypothetical protein
MGRSLDQGEKVLILFTDSHLRHGLVNNRFETLTQSSGSLLLEARCRPVFISIQKFARMGNAHLLYRIPKDVFCFRGGLLSRMIHAKVKGFHLTAISCHPDINRLEIVLTMGSPSPRPLPQLWGRGRGEGASGCQYKYETIIKFLRFLNRAGKRNLDLGVVVIQSMTNTFAGSRFSVPRMPTSNNVSLRIHAINQDRVCVGTAMRGRLGAEIAFCTRMVSGS